MQILSFSLSMSKVVAERMKTFCISTQTDFVKSAINVQVTNTLAGRLIFHNFVLTYLKIQCFRVDNRFGDDKRKLILNLRCHKWYLNGSIHRVFFTDFQIDI